jgi:prepilin-type N-terminal cleavage/methylation domain-containing protein
MFCWNKNHMKPCCTTRRNQGMNLFEVLIVVAIVVVLAAIVLYAGRPQVNKAMAIRCINNLKQAGLAYRLWAQDHNDLFPMQVSVNNDGAMELAATGNVAAVFQVMSNELSMPIILFCPGDMQHHNATNFASLTATNISYFVSLDAGTNYSGNLILSGDANLTVGGAPVKSGLFNLASNAPAGWTSDRHYNYGNLGFNDCSVGQFTSSGLAGRLVQTGLATNRLAIP